MRTRAACCSTLADQTKHLPSKQPGAVSASQASTVMHFAFIPSVQELMLQPCTDIMHSPWHCQYRTDVRLPHSTPQAEVRLASLPAHSAGRLCHKQVCMQRCMLEAPHLPRSGVILIFHLEDDRLYCMPLYPHATPAELDDYA